MDAFWRKVSQRLTDNAERRCCGDGDYELLPNDSSLRSPPPPPRRRRLRLKSLLHLCSLRRTLIFIAALPFLLVIAVVWSGVPPSYQDIRLYERKLPQHDLAAARAENRLYLRFPDHLWGHGLNNILQEALLLSYVAARANRSFVFEDYVWSHSPLPYTLYDFTLRPVRLPLNAFISGPTAGGPVSSYPPAVSAEFWDSVCPPEKRRVISSRDTPGKEAAGSEILKYWENKLRDVKDECVSIDSTEARIFDFDFFGGDHIISLWPDLSKHPILTDFQWSPLVQSTVLRNFVLFQPYYVKSLYDSSSRAILPGLVAVHLRRGDYKRHCPRLASWNSTYNGLNAFPQLPDQFNPWPLGEGSEPFKAYYMQHCLPDVNQIVTRLRAVRAQHPGLRRVYVLTNGWSWWLSELKAALQKDGWDDLKSSLDVQLDAAQTYVAMAVDMAIAQKAEVFVGNGFSSLSSNIVMLRMAKGLDVSSNRFL